MRYITISIMPVLLLIFSIVLNSSKKNLLDSFILGAKEGMECCLEILPTLVLVMCCIGAVFSSGTVDVLCALFKPLFDILDISADLLPAIVLRPFSGSGVTAIADKMFKELGSDSIVSKTACLLMGSTDTIIYTLSVYFSSINIKKTRYALSASLVVFCFSVFVSLWLARIFL